MTRKKTLFQYVADFAIASPAVSVLSAADFAIESPAILELDLGTPKEITNTGRYARGSQSE